MIKIYDLHIDSYKLKTLQVNIVSNVLVAIKNVVVVSVPNSIYLNLKLNNRSITSGSSRPNGHLIKILFAEMASGLYFFI